MILALAVRVTEPPLAESVVPPDFSLCKGGPVYDLGQRLRLRESVSLIRLGIGFALLTWIPLAVLTAVEGVISNGPTITFLQSVGTHVRLLLAIPLFFSPKRCSTPVCRTSFGGFSKCNWCCHATSRGWRRRAAGDQGAQLADDGSAARDPRRSG